MEASKDGKPTPVHHERFTPGRGCLGFLQDLITLPSHWASLYRFNRKWKAMPKGLTAEQDRRYWDLGDPYAEYADDDPRKYGVYSGHTKGYIPKPGEVPFCAKDEDPSAVQRIRR